MKLFKILLVTIVIFSTLNASTSLPFELDDNFYQDKYESILRFKALQFNNGELDQKSKKQFIQIIKKIEELQKASKKFKITLVGHNFNEDAYYPKNYVTKLDYKMHKFKEDTQSKESVLTLKDKFIDNKVDKKVLYIYDQGGRFLAYTDINAKSQKLSNRVMVTVYILQEADLDSDKDGVINRYDRCEDTPLNANVDKNGCLVDSDYDGVYDYMDRCPDTPPKGVIVDEFGCPLDSDMDGVLDYKDRCINTQEGVVVDEDGCPTKKRLKLNFKYKSDKITKTSYNEIKKFAQFLQEHPHYKVKIFGYTDSKGNHKSNMTLSTNRAESVKKALISEGIDKSRIIAIGRGELDPIASNETKEGRAKNRRIEVQLFE